MRRLWLGLRALLFPTRVERELDAEMQFHNDMQVQQLVQRGLTESDARDAALRSFGNRGRHKEYAREVRYLAGVDDFLRDIASGLSRSSNPEELQELISRGPAALSPNVGNVGQNTAGPRGRSAARR